LLEVDAVGYGATGVDTLLLEADELEAEEEETTGGV